MAPSIQASQTTRTASPPRAAEVAGVRITHADRVLYREAGLTKEDLARYYAAIAPHMLPHVRGRPLTLLRCPDGAEAPCTFVRHLRAWAAAPLRRVTIQEKTKADEYLVADTAEALVALAQLDVLEIHTWNARVETLEQPDQLVLDLDPGPGVTWVRVVDAAQRIRRLLEDVGLTSFAKTTGGKGLHVVVPLQPAAGWSECLEFARAVAQCLERRDPHAFTASMVKNARAGRIYVDYLRNHRAASSIAPFSTRARSAATVAVPVSWEEVAAGLRSSDLDVRKALARVDGAGRVAWAGIDRVKQRLRSGMLRAIAR